MGKIKVLKDSFNQFVYLNFYPQSVVSLKERNIKLLLESVTYITITETVTCILQEKQLCIAESTICIVATETPTCINTIKIVTPIFDAKTVTCI